MGLKFNFILEGKTTLCKILTGWASRSDWNVLFVSLDVADSGITIPGVIGAVSLDGNPLDVEEGFGTQTNPLLYFYGHTNPKANVDLLAIQVKKLSETIEQKMK